MNHLPLIVVSALLVAASLVILIQYLKIKSLKKENKRTKENNKETPLVLDDPEDSVSFYFYDWEPGHQAKSSYILKSEFYTANLYDENIGEIRVNYRSQTRLGSKYSNSVLIKNLNQTFKEMSKESQISFFKDMYPNFVERLNIFPYKSSQLATAD